MALLGDLDSDGAPEIAISAPGYGVWGRRDLGWVGIYSTKDFRLLRSFTGVNCVDPPMTFHGDQLGIPVSSAGDVDKDGTPDILIGTYHEGQFDGPTAWARLELRSGRTGRLLTVYEGFQPDHVPFFKALAPLGDVDGDGAGEFLVGSPYAPGVSRRGQVRLVRYIPDLPRFIRGDANQDGRVNLSDAIRLFGILLSGDRSFPCTVALDVDGSDRIDVNDVISIIWFIFLGDYPPRPPYPECSSLGGFNNTRLDCAASTCEG